MKNGFFFTDKKCLKAKVTYFDPFGYDMEARRRKMIVNFLADLFKVNEIEIIMNNFQIQKDGYNCGVFICAWLIYFIGDLRHMPSKDTIVNFRNVIYNTIFENSEIV